MSSAVEIEGIPRLRRSAQRIENAVHDDGGAMERAITAAMQSLVGPMRAGAPVAKGKLRDSIRSVVRRYRMSGVVVGLTGPSWPRGSHGHLVEFGTTARRTARGYYRGSAPSRPFVHPAYNPNSITAIIERELATSIDREADA